MTTVTRTRASHRSVDATLHLAAMALMVAVMLPLAPLTFLGVIGVLLALQAVAAVLLRLGWRIEGAFVDLLAVSAAVALPLLLGGHPHGTEPAALQSFAATLSSLLVAAAWAGARLWVGVRGRWETGMFAVMATAMAAMAILHAL